MRLLTPKHLREQITWFEEHSNTAVRVRGLFLCREIELLHALLKEHNITVPGLVEPEPPLPSLGQARDNHILAALERTKGNISAACELLQMRKASFYDWRDHNPANRQATDAIIRRATEHRGGVGSRRSHFTYRPRNHGITP
jgi:hypothetical protein